MGTKPTRDTGGANPRAPIAAEPLTEAAFCAYGEIVENRTGLRRRDLSVPFQATDVAAAPALWVNRLEQHGSSGIHIDRMECHPHSAQTFVPMHLSRCLAVVALSDGDGKPDLGSLRAFVTQAGQGLCYRPAVWHYAFTSLDGPNEVVVIMGSAGGDGDTIVEPVVPGVDVMLELDRENA